MSNNDTKVGKFVEAQLEEAVKIMSSTEQGYTVIDGLSIHRKLDEILIKDDIKAFLNRQYASDSLSDIEIEKIINKLDMLSSASLYETNRETYRLVSEGFDFIRDDASKLALHINYIDFENVDNNSFKVITQYTVEHNNNTRRPDLLIFINGIPIAIFEFKTVIEEDITIFDAWKQITIRYTRDIPNLLKYCFLSVISDGANTKMGSIFTPYEYYYSWNKVNSNDTVSNGISSLLTMLNGAFAKDRVLAILRDFVFYPDESKKSLSVVTRYPQFFATSAMFDNIRKHLKPSGDGKGGTYFGATGCGKTYTMLFLARKLITRDNDTFRNPTIIIITDREDLDTQTSELFVTSKKYLHEEDVRSIETRDDLQKTLAGKPSGGVYITTIQKFCENIGLLSERNNIICISDEAHRTQTGINAKLKKTDKGITTTYGFAKYLHDSFPNATYCGFTGTPIDETISVFGDVVDSYTMKESTDDEITVGLAYEPRLARVCLSDEQVKKIEEYYNQCLADGSNEEQVEESKRAMTSMKSILGHPDRIKKLAEDIVNHYSSLCNEKPEIVQKAMIVCADRMLAFTLLKEILLIKPDWGDSNKIDTDKYTEEDFTKEQLSKLTALPKINLVATRSKDDEKELYDLCGNKEYRQMLDKQFKNNDSNFKIAIVVDMWITGFDVPSLAVMYIDKPLQKHTLIQTISRVNRVFDGKDKGLVVDYIGIKNDMMEAIKQYSSTQESPIDEIQFSISILKEHLDLIDKIMHSFDSSDFYSDKPYERLMCLNRAAEFVQISKDTQTQFMELSKKMKAAYNVCFHSGELSDEEVLKSQFYLAIRSIIFKQTIGTAPDAEVMNKHVEDMIKGAISCSGVENIINNKSNAIDLFDDSFIKKLDEIPLPISKFNALLKLLKDAISAYSKSNKVKALEFEERLKQVIDKYNTRDDTDFKLQVVYDVLSEIMKDLQEDKKSFEKLGITYEEKVFYDILIKVRDTHKFDYEDDKCLILAKEIKDLVVNKTQFADWSTRDDIKSQLEVDIIKILYNHSYPDEWSDEVFSKVLEQTKNL